MKTRHANWLSSGPFRLSDEKDIWVKVWPKSIKK